MGGRKFPKSWGGARIPGKLNLHVAKTKEKKRTANNNYYKALILSVNTYFIIDMACVCVCGGSYPEKEEEITVEKRNETRENLL